MLTEKQIIDSMFEILDAGDEAILTNYNPLRTKTLREAELSNFQTALLMCFMKKAAEIEWIDLCEPFKDEIFEPYYRIKLRYHKGEPLENEAILYIDKKYTETV
jgi:hypothetical protein